MTDISLDWSSSEGSYVSMENYHISVAIRRSFVSFRNNSKNLDPSYKMNLDHWDCLGRVKLVL